MLRKAKVLFTGYSGNLGRNFSELYGRVCDIDGIAKNGNKEQVGIKNHILCDLSQQLSSEFLNNITEANYDHLVISSVSKPYHVNLDTTEEEGVLTSLLNESIVSGYLIAKAFTKSDHLRNRSITIISSTSAIYPETKMFYGVIKAAQQSLSYQLAYRLKSTKIRSNCLLPGRFDIDVKLDEISARIFALQNNLVNGEMLILN